MAWECTGKKKTCFMLLINLIIVAIIFAIGFVVGYYVMKYKKEEAAPKCNCKPPQRNVTMQTTNSEEKLSGSEQLQNEFVSPLKSKGYEEIVSSGRQRRKAVEKLKALVWRRKSSRKASSRQSLKSPQAQEWQRNKIVGKNTKIFVIREKNIDNMQSVTAFQLKLLEFYQCTND